MSSHGESKRQEYKVSGWSDKPTLFALSTRKFLPKTGSMLELGAGLGQDSVYFAQEGFTVVSSDVVLDTKLTFPSGVERKMVDITDSLKFQDKHFDVVYAHLSLHYFTTEKTKQLFSEIYRVLKKDGVVAFLVNSTNDPEWGTGREIEKDYFNTEGTNKRFFTVDSVREFTQAFEEILCDDQGESYKDNAKGVHQLIRYIGRKR